jgi:hypothetical protein
MHVNNIFFKLFLISAHQNIQTILNSNPKKNYSWHDPRHERQILSLDSGFY